MIIIKARLRGAIFDGRRFAAGFGFAVAVAATSTSAATSPTPRTRARRILVSLAITADGHVGIKTLCEVIVTAVTGSTAIVACVTVVTI